MSYSVFLTPQAKKDLVNLERAGLKGKVDILIKKMQADPYCVSPSYEKLTGNYRGAYSRRINIKHRLVYQILEQEKAIKILRMWTHYE
jgi:toxin YoeB